MIDNQIVEVSIYGFVVCLILMYFSQVYCSAGKNLLGSLIFFCGVIGGGIFIYCIARYERRVEK